MPLRRRGSRTAPAALPEEERLVADGELRRGRLRPGVEDTGPQSKPRSLVRVLLISTTRERISTWRVVGGSGAGIAGREITSTSDATAVTTRRMRSASAWFRTRPSSATRQFNTRTTMFGRFSASWIACAATSAGFGAGGGSRPGRIVTRFCASTLKARRMALIRSRTPPGSRPGLPRPGCDRAPARRCPGRLTPLHLRRRAAAGPAPAGRHDGHAEDRPHAAVIDEEQRLPRRPRREDHRHQPNGVTSTTRRVDDGDLILIARNSRICDWSGCRTAGRARSRPPGRRRGRARPAGLAEHRTQHPLSRVPGTRPRAAGWPEPATRSSPARWAGETASPARAPSGSGVACYDIRLAGQQERHAAEKRERCRSPTPPAGRRGRS